MQYENDEPHLLPPPPPEAWPLPVRYVCVVLTVAVVLLAVLVVIGIVGLSRLNDIAQPLNALLDAFRGVRR